MSTAAHDIERLLLAGYGRRVRPALRKDLGDSYGSPWEDYHDRRFKNPGRIRGTTLGWLTAAITKEPQCPIRRTARIARQSRT
jgi:hypothetical protein